MGKAFRKFDKLSDKVFSPFGLNTMKPSGFRDVTPARVNEIKNFIGALYVAADLALKQDDLGPHHAMFMVQTLRAVDKFALLEDVKKDWSRIAPEDVFTACERLAVGNHRELSFSFNDTETGAGGRPILRWPHVSDNSNESGHNTQLSEEEFNIVKGAVDGRSGHDLSRFFLPQNRFVGGEGEEDSGVGFSEMFKKKRPEMVRSYSLYLAKEPGRARVEKAIQLLYDIDMEVYNFKQVPMQNSLTQDDKETFLNMIHVFKGDLLEVNVRGMLLTYDDAHLLENLEKELRDLDVRRANHGTDPSSGYDPS